MMVEDKSDAPPDPGDAKATTEMTANPVTPVSLAATTDPVDVKAATDMTTDPVALVPAATPKGNEATKAVVAKSTTTVTDEHRKAVRAILDQTELEDEEEEEAKRGGSPTAALVRDSAVVLGAGTGLLYLASHLLGSQYLEIFGIYGFHGVGVGHLGMLPFGLLAILFLVTVATYEFMSSASLLAAIVGSIAILACVATRPLCVMYADVPLTRGDIFQMVVGGIAWASAIFAHVLARISKKDADAAKSKDEERFEGLVASYAARVESDKNQPNAPIRAKEKHEESQARLDIASRRLKLSRARRDRSRARYKLALAVGAGYTAAVVAFPSLSAILATAAISSEHWQAIEPNGAHRTPVYWVDDRVVFLAREGGKCIVTTQIDGNVTSKRECPPYVDAMYEP